MEQIKVGKKHLKQFDLRIIGDSPEYPFHEVAFFIEQLINTKSIDFLQKLEDFGMVSLPKVKGVRVHIFDRNKPIIPYEIGHDPLELVEQNE